MKYGCEVGCMIGGKLVQLAGLLGLRISRWVNTADHAEYGWYIPGCAKQPKILARRRRGYLCHAVGAKRPRDRAEIIQGHPDPVGKRLCHALADACAAGAAVAGHEITRIEVARLDFPILRTQEGFKHSQLPRPLVEARDAIVSAQHLVIVFHCGTGDSLRWTSPAAQAVGALGL
jgi:hypothetical protein